MALLPIGAISKSWVVCLRGKDSAQFRSPEPGRSNLPEEIAERRVCQNFAAAGYAPAMRRVHVRGVAVNCTSVPRLSCAHPRRPVSALRNLSPLAVSIVQFATPWRRTDGHTPVLQVSAVTVVPSRTCAPSSRARLSRRSSNKLRFIEQLAVVAGLEDRHSPLRPSIAMNSTESSLECGKSTDTLCETEAFHHWPARWIQAIATNFFPGKFFPLKNKRPQTRVRAKRGAARSGGAAANDCNIKDFHRA